MTTSLTYATVMPVSEGVREQVEADARGLRHDWWAEPFVFSEDPDGKGRLYGDTKLFLIGYGKPGCYHEVDANDDWLMAGRDAEFITKNLKRWSAEHGLSWQLWLEGEAVGAIDSGILDDAGMEFLAGLFDEAGVPKSEREARVQEVSNLYADRWGEKDSG